MEKTAQVAGGQANRVIVGGKVSENNGDPRSVECDEGNWGHRLLRGECHGGGGAMDG